MNRFKDKNIKRSLALTLKFFYLAGIKNKLDRTVAPMFCNRREPSTTEIVQQGSNYVPREFEGESLVTLGRAKIFQQNGADLIINCSSLGCMHGNITSTFFEHWMDHNDCPLIDCTFDGLVGDNNLPIYINEALRHNHRNN